MTVDNSDNNPNSEGIASNYMINEETMVESEKKRKKIQHGRRSSGL
jgi:hypothetical protein